MFTSDGFLRAAHRVWWGQESFGVEGYIRWVQGEASSHYRFGSPPFHRMNAEAREAVLSFAEAAGMPRKDALAEFDRAGEE